MCEPHYRAYRYATDPAYKERVKAENKKWGSGKGAQSRRESVRNCRLKEKGFSSQLVESLHDLQQGRCAICARSMEVSGHGIYRRCADHDHETGVPRGLLCSPCNLGLGYYEKHQKPAGLSILPYEAYLRSPPARHVTMSG